MLMIPNLDKYRAAARRDAWYDNDDDPPNYNPFRKIHRRNKARPGDEELGADLTAVGSEGNALDIVERQRRSQNFEAYSPSHAATMPSSSGTPTNRSPVELPFTEKRDMVERQTESSQDTGTTKSSHTVVGSTDSKPKVDGDVTPRKRGIFSRFRKTPEEKEQKVENKRKSRSASWLKRDKQTFTAMGQFRATILNSWINVLLIFVPIGIAVNFTSIPKVGVFVINFIAIIPLAAMLSYATEEIALRTGETIGGLLNATFGLAQDASFSFVDCH